MLWGFMRRCGSGKIVGSTGVYSATGGFYGEGNTNFNLPGNHDSSGYSSHDGYTTFVSGIAAGLGGGIIVSNAKRAEDLRGPFDTWNLSIGIWAVQFAADENGTVTASLGVTKRVGLSLSRYKVNTDAAVTISGASEPCECKK